jgi:enamine deaminase RidA (YjgF/YER057c/UK114 family)
MTQNSYSAQVAQRLKDLNLSLPQVAPPAANYVPYILTKNSLAIAGQIPFLNGQKDHIGRLGQSMTLEQGQAAAQACALNILAQVHSALNGDWDRLQQTIRLGVFVNSTPDFDQHPHIANGASDLMVAVLGEKGKHTRAAVGVANLPFGVAVEIDALFEIKI